MQETTLAQLVNIHVGANGPCTFESVMEWCTDQWSGGRPDPSTVRRILADPMRYRVVYFDGGTAGEFPVYERTTR